MSDTKHLSSYHLTGMFHFAELRTKMRIPSGPSGEDHGRPPKISC